jgi:cytochrome b
MARGIGRTEAGVVVWDLPTRIGHWAIAGLVGFSWWSAETGHMDWHRWSGYAVLAFVVWRIYWGFAGSETSRFGSFVRGPAATLAYLRTLPQRSPSAMLGHNPLGALSVLALLAALVAQVVFGLFATDIDGLESGPLSDRVDFDTGRMFAHWHQTSFTVLQVLVALHLAAVVFYLVYKRSNLVAAMITGRRRLAEATSPAMASRWRLLAGVVLALAIAWWVSKGLRL